MKLLNFVIVSSIILICSATSFSATPAKETLLSSWENIQKNNPGVLIFQKTGENTYKFKTNIFPYDGVIRVLNLVIRDNDMNLGPVEDMFVPSATGIIELELVGFNQEMQMKYSNSFFMWAQDNNLFFDAKENKWITNKEYQQINASYFKKYSPNNFITSLMEYWQYLLIFIIIYFVFVTFKQNKRGKNSIKTIEESINLQKETNNILRMILEETKNKKL